jgi:hypothetical protein
MRVTPADLGQFGSLLGRWRVDDARVHPGTLDDKEGRDWLTDPSRVGIGIVGQVLLSAY